MKAACQNGVSNLSDLLAVSVLYELSAGGPKKCIDLIVKLLPHDPFSRYFVTEAQFDLREINFYTRILPDLLRFQRAHLRAGATAMAVSVPKCFHTQYTAGTLPAQADASPEAPESILVLEDMRPLGYRVCSHCWRFAFGNRDGGNIDAASRFVFVSVQRRRTSSGA